MRKSMEMCVMVRKGKGVRHFQTEYPLTDGGGLIISIIRACPLLSLIAQHTFVPPCWSLAQSFRSVFPHGEWTAPFFGRQWVVLSGIRHVGWISQSVALIVQLVLPKMLHEIGCHQGLGRRRQGEDSNRRPQRSQMRLNS